jgi:hypothetical protein
MPRFIYLLRANARSESEPPSTDVFQAMFAYNGELVNAGILVDADGLLATEKGYRITFNEPAAPGVLGASDESQITVQAGPFPPESTVCGWWIVKTKDVDEAISWAKRAPLRDGATIEIRQIAAAEDFGDNLTDELKEKEQKLRAEAAKRANASVG